MSDLIAEPEIKTACRNCGAISGETHLCPDCGRVKPISQDPDYFAFLGLPRKLLIDEQELERSFYSLSRRLHPDYFMNAGPEERQASIQRASLLNDAYRTLRDPVSRVRYLLSLEGRKDAGKKAPPEMLEEVFELNMQIDDLKAARKSGDVDEVGVARAALSDAQTELNARLLEIDEQLKESSREWDSVTSSVESPNQKVVLDRFSDLLSYRAYIRNLIQNIEEELEEES